MTGRIKLLNEKGFGFIKSDDGGKDIFFHATGLLNADWTALAKDDKVEFSVEDTPKGKKAIGIRLMGR